MPFFTRWTRGLVALAGGAALAGAVACSDVASPTAARPAASAARAVPPSANPSLISVSTTIRADTITQKLKVDPRTPTVLRYFNGDAIVIPAYAICDVETSGYGPTYWNQPCQPQVRNLTITVKYFTNKATGLPSMDFEPHMRFQPTPAGVTTIYFHQGPQDFFSKSILYCPNDVKSADPAKDCLDEGATDPDLVTHHDAAFGFLYRQVKHFSGYLVAVGFTGSVDVSAGM